jgi:hypothetical protein
MIELVDRLEADEQWGIVVLLQDDGGGERSFEAMRGSMPDDAAKTP